eukprot:6628113-Alexandrium_andersonii.AAC.1
MRLKSWLSASGVETERVRRPREGARLAAGPPPKRTRSSRGLSRHPCVGHKAHTEGAPRARRV